MGVNTLGEIARKVIPNEERRRKEVGDESDGSEVFARLYRNWLQLLLVKPLLFEKRNALSQFTTPKVFPFWAIVACLILKPSLKEATACPAL